MIRRLVFVGVVVLSLSSAASAGVWDWLAGFAWTQSTPNSQQQGYSGTMGQAAVNVGPGSTAGTNQGGYSNTQTNTTPSGSTMTQSQSVAGSQTTFITGSPGSVGMSFQTTRVKTWQGQFLF
jgi:hypothetical protein